MPSMKIAIDIRRMTEFGVGTYIRNVVRTLGKLDRDNKYLLLGSPAKVKELGSLPPNFHTVPLMEPERSIKSYRQFRAILKRFECDLVHIPNLFSIPRRSEEHTSELQSQFHLVCRLLLEKKKTCN